MADSADPSVIFFEDQSRGYIGKQALAADEVMRQTFAGRLTPVARSFKRTLGRASQQAVAEYGHQPISARQTATVFLKELLKKTVERERLFTTSSIPKWNFPRRFVAWARREGLVNDLTMTCPVDSFEPYRMELQNIARKLGSRSLKPSTSRLPRRWDTESTWWRIDTCSSWTSAEALLISRSCARTLPVRASAQSARPPQGRAYRRARARSRRRDGG